MCISWMFQTSIPSSVCIYTALILKHFCPNPAGTLYVQMGRWDDGEKELRRALELNPHHHGAMNNLKVAQHYKMKQNR